MKHHTRWKCYDKIWSTGGGNGNSLLYSCNENPMNSMKRQKDMTIEDETPGQKVSNMLLGKVLETETRIWPGTKNISATPSPFSASLGCLIHCPLLSQLQLLHAQGCEHYGHLTISRLLHPVKENKTSQAPTQMKLGMSIHCQVKWIYDLTLGPVRGK